MGPARPAAQPCRDGCDELAQHDRGERGVEHHPGAQRVRDGQDPLAHRDRGRDAIDEVSGEVCHAAADARGREPAALT